MYPKAKLPPLKISINVAKESDLNELLKEKDSFYTEITHKPTSKNEVVFIARETTPQRKIVGFVKGRVIKEANERLGEVLVISARKGMKGRSIGPRLLGKMNSYFIARRIKRAELVSFANEFYMNRSNYRARAIDADELESSIKTLEANLSRKPHRKIKRTPNPKKHSLAPQNIFNKDALMKRRLKLK